MLIGTSFSLKILDFFTETQEKEAEEFITFVSLPLFLTVFHTILYRTMYR